jgi:hypothetical protein
MNDDQIRELFGEMREEAVPGASLARVRRAVGAAVESRRRVFGGVWKAAVLLAAAGCLAVVMWQARTVERPAQTTVRVPVVQAPVVEVEQIAPAPAPVVHKQVRAVAKPVREIERAPVENGGASEIRIESPYEPDVVIVLIGG